MPAPPTATAILPPTLAGRLLVRRSATRLLVPAARDPPCCTGGRLAPLSPLSPQSPRCGPPSPAPTTAPSLESPPVGVTSPVTSATPNEWRQAPDRSTAATIGPAASTP